MDRQIRITIPTDGQGMIGRECLKCKQYFKLKPGTGLPTSYCHCPYCDYEGNADTFWTPEQVEYANSIAEKEAYHQIVEPFLDNIGDMFKDLERKTRDGFLQIKVTQTRDTPYFPIKTYNEKKLETYVTCDNCKLQFAVYGVFATCPDCKQLNAFTVFKKSIEVTQKLLDFVDTAELTEEMKDVQFKSILSNSISVFDGLGKALKQKYSDRFPDRPKNLFQNFTELNNVLSSVFGLTLSSDIIEFGFLVKMFQVRHIYEHNYGVVDEECIKKIPSLRTLKGRKYKLNKSEIEKFLTSLLLTSDKIQNVLP
jgi:hypothetical protein